MRVNAAIAAVVLAAALFYVFADFSNILAWAVEAQRGFQNQMAGAVRALKAGDPGAFAALLAGAAAYGFVHALGPGHGKYLVGGVGLATSVSTPRLVGLATVSSLAQSLWAIAIVFGGFYLLEATARQMTDLAEDVLAPASYLAIACVGLAFVWRGSRAMRQSLKKGHHHHGDCGCHGHGPTQEDVARLTSWRDAVVLVGSIAVRPCTGALFLLVIAWQMDLVLAGAVAVVVMGLGTAGLTSLVAVSSTAARGLAFASSGAFNSLQVAMPTLQIFTGAMIAIISLGLLRLVW